MLTEGGWDEWSDVIAVELCLMNMFQYWKREGGGKSQYINHSQGHKAIFKLGGLYYVPICLEIMCDNAGWVNLHYLPCYK